MTSEGGSTEEVKWYYLGLEIVFEITDTEKMSRENEDTNFSYYHEYCRLYLANVVLLSQLRELFNERNELASKFSKLEKKGKEIEEGERHSDDKKKRFRRTAN